MNYSPTDCFETFPFSKRWESNDDLELTGREYYDFRAALMVRNNEGLTKTYNRFHDPDERDPDIVKLRELHAAMDPAVLNAYGWTDIQPTCEFILDDEDDEDETDGKPSRRRNPGATAGLTRSATRSSVGCTTVSSCGPRRSGHEARVRDSSRVCD